MKNKSDLLVNTDEDLDYMEENKEKSSSKKMDPSNKSPKNDTNVKPLQYKDFLTYIVKKYAEEYENLNLNEDSKKSVYTLYEDLKIIYILAKENNICAKSFKKLTLYVPNRTEESLRSRYKDFLIKLN